MAIRNQYTIPQFANFTRNTAGLEKTLRLIHAVALIASVTTEHGSALAKQWTTTKSQLALTRRFFRFFAFIDCFDRVYGLLGNGSSEGGLTFLIELARWICLGLYFVLEDLTILHAMNVHPVSWNQAVIEQAYRFWAYALCLSVVGAFWGLLGSGTEAQRTQKGGDKKGNKKPRNGKEKTGRKTLVHRVVVDGCDLLIPAAFLGWVRVGEGTVGMAMVVRLD
ncbi:PEX11 domain protein [Aspergillus tanneri]|uniref:Uncharacterized protein n=1 Tax=Aspergillus tanneri TaxID=1220188 RepID=A0A5M9MV89_9EURO|nr:uncharacterized protein ATNIH1004_003487 [Aspergillus tanneri]KAA8650798.1 hypothetical protein ATNIH1004_003487 [Aspergillus tanneri]